MNVERFLARRWAGLCARLGARGDVWSPFQKLKEDYSMPERAYHNLGHVYECLQHFDKAKYFLVHHDAIEMALFQHDRVYFPAQKGNEEISAFLALQDCKMLTGNERFSQDVHRLVLATDHKDVSQKFDECSITDIDKAILGASRRRYDEYSSTIRQEYSMVSDEDYRVGRMKFIEGMIERPVYNTHYFHMKFCDNAYGNLERELESLRRNKK